MGKILIMCAGEQERWDSKVPKQILPVLDGEQLLARTVRQVRKRWNNYPHIVTHQKCLRSYSTNYITPSARRWICETLLSIAPIWGPDWSMILLGDVVYTDELMDIIYKQRDKFQYHFYGNGGEIFALTFTDNPLIEESLMDVVDDADFSFGRGKLWELYYRLSNKPLPEAGKGYTGQEDDLHFTYVIDDTTDFDTYERYKEWILKHRMNK